MAIGELTTVVRHIQRLAGGAETGDGVLLERFLARRDETAFADLVRRHGPMVLGLCRRVLGDGHDAEDAFQATFLVLFRRAGTLRGQRGSLGGWLYTVAHHVALKARTQAGRRERREQRAAATATGVMPEPTWNDVRPILDEELNHLPRDYRDAIVLCYLQGKTNTEAARLLGWPVGTVKGRLARARDLLRVRLTRRGVTLSVAALAGTLERSATAALPGRLVQATLDTSLPPTAAASASAVALADGAVKTLFAARLKLTAAALLLAGLVTLAVGACACQAFAQRQPDSHPAQRLADKDAMRAKRPPAGKPAPGLPGEEVAVRGRVVGEDRKGLAGAEVSIVAWPVRRSAEAPKVLGQVRTDAEGKFRLTVKRPAQYEAALLASAKGHGLGWQGPLGDKEVEVPLRAERPVRLRLIDLQGQPAAGVKVFVARLGQPAPASGKNYVLLSSAASEQDGEDEDAPGMRAVLDRSASMGVERIVLWDPQTGRRLPVLLGFAQGARGVAGWPAAGVTDAEGRVTLRGISPDQGVGVQVRDSRFALQVVDVPRRDKDNDGEITRVLAPVRTLEGTVIDATTGKPLANARIRIPSPNSGGGLTFSISFSPDGIGGADAKGRRGLGQDQLLALAFAETFTDVYSGGELPSLQARTDDKGRFKLTLFRAGSYSLRVTPAAGEPYLPRTVRVGWPGPAVVRKQVNIEMTPGVPVRGKVTEAPGGKAIEGARVDFWSKEVKLPEGVRRPRHATTRADGTFEALLPPGSWHLLVNGPAPVYLFEKLPMDKLTDEQPEPVRIRPGAEPQKADPAPKRFFHPDAWVAVDLKAGGAAPDVAVTLRRAPVLRGRVVGPDGEPLKDVRMLRRPLHPFETLVYQDSATSRLLLDLTGRRTMERMWSDALGDSTRGELGPLGLRDGTFGIPVLEPDATYRLYFLNRAKGLGGVAELKAKQAGGEAVTVRLEPCGSARVRFVDGKGKPLAGHQPKLRLLTLPASKEPASKDAVDSVPASSGKGPLTDAEGRVTLSALIPGATYRLPQPGGQPHDFTVRSGQTVELPDLTVLPPPPKGKQPEKATKTKTP